MGASAQVHLADGPHAGGSFVIGVLEDTLLVADEPWPGQYAGMRIDPHAPPVPVAVYELHTELICPDGSREGTYRYAGHRYPPAADHLQRPGPFPAGGAGHGGG